MATKKAAVPQEYKEKYVRFDLSNVEVWWAHLNKPDTAFGNNKWSVEMHLEDATAAELLKRGFNVKDKTLKDGSVVKNVLTAKREVMLKSGKKQDPPVVVGLDGSTPFTDDIGNGSICNLKLSAKAWQIKGEWSISVYVEAVQVVKHVAYGGSSFANLSDTEDVPF